MTVSKRKKALRLHRRPKDLFSKQEMQTDRREHFLLVPWEQKGYGAYVGETLVFIYQTENQCRGAVQSHNEILERVYA